MPAVKRWGAVKSGSLGDWVFVTYDLLLVVCCDPGPKVQWLLNLMNPFKRYRRGC